MAALPNFRQQLVIFTRKFVHSVKWIAQFATKKFLSGNLEITLQTFVLEQPFPFLRQGRTISASLQIILRNRENAANSRITSLWGRSYSSGERDSTGRWKFWTFGAGTEDKMSKFFFKINLFKEELSVRWKAQVISIDKPSAEVLQQNGILSIDNDFLRRLCTVDVKDENYYRLDYDFEVLEI